MPASGTMTVRQGGVEGARKALRRPSRIYARKTDVILAAAERVFLREGFAATSMDDIAEEAGVSKRTVYSNFNSKEQLFAQVIRKRCAAVLPNPEVFAKALHQAPEAGLVTLAVAFLKGIFDPGQVELYQTVVAAVRRRPDVGRIMYEGPIQETQRLFAEFLDSHIREGRLAIDDADLAATQLIALLKSNMHMKLMFGRPVRIGPKLIGESARASVRLFLNGALPRP